MKLVNENNFQNNVKMRLFDLIKRKSEVKYGFRVDFKVNFRFI